MAIGQAERELAEVRGSTTTGAISHTPLISAIFWSAKVRYRGIAKNLARAFSLFALANLYLVRRQLLPRRLRCVL